MEGMELKEALSRISQLVTPTNTSAGGKGKSWFLTILQSKNEEYCQAVNGTLTLNEDICFDYVRCCVNALSNLKFQLNFAVETSKKEENKGLSLEPDALSISQQRSVSSLIEMIVVLGILPNLISGVGVPLHKRSDFLHVLDDLPEKKILEKYKQLVFSLDFLLDISQHRSFATLVLTKHLGDILGTLIQICNAPLKKPSEDIPELQLENDTFVMTNDLYVRLSNDQEKYKQDLERLLEKNYQPTVIKNLMVLHCNSKESKPPKWFSKKVSELLSARLASKSGVVNVIRAIMDIGGDAENMDWEKIGLVATVLGSPPQGNYTSTEQYYKKICPQLLNLLNYDDKIYQMIACASIKTVSERSLILSRRYLFDVLLEPLCKLAENEEMGLSVTEQDIDDCLKSLFKIFVIGTDPCIMFLTNLDPVILIILELHATITFGSSHLRDPVKQILLRYLKYSDTDKNILVMRSFALAEVPDAGKSRMKLFQKDLIFMNGNEGGVKVGRRVSSDQSFYVSDDEKSIVIQDLLEELKDKKLTVDFYMSLMSDLTDIIVKESKPEPELPEASEGQNIEEQLLGIEAHLDTSMHKMRKNLMIIRLLGLLSEEQDLQDNLLKESKRMITFIGATLKRGAISLGSCGESQGIMAVQSLNMALSILSLHLTQADVSVEDWEKMQEYSVDLQVLSSHPDNRISRISAQLHQLVLAQGAIINETNNIKEQTKKILEETEKIKLKTHEMKHLQKERENEQMDEKKKIIKEKSEELKKAKERRKKGLKEEESEFKIVEDKTGLSAYESAIYDIADPLLPVRGHGIIELSKLVDQQDPETIRNIDNVCRIFQDSLEDDDTYIYLASISGLVSCVRHSPDSILQILTNEFSMVYQRKNLGGKAMEVRTKIGEALVRITKELGELTPKYKNLLLNTFFTAAGDTDELVRASSLSNLGEVCKNLRFSLGSITGELLLHLESSSRDKCKEVRRAAAMVLTMMLNGLGKDALSVLEASLRDIHRSLRIRLAVETDETALIHINLAIDEIDKIVRELFTSNVLNQLKISVINPHT